MRIDHSALPSSSSRLQFFVRISSDHTYVLHADPSDTIRTIHEKIRSITGIPVIEQGLIYSGKQLQWEQTLAGAGVQNDAGLQLVGRMRSTQHHQAWHLVNDVVSSVFYLYKNNPLSPSVSLDKTIRSMLLEFVAMTPRINLKKASGHLQIFSAFSAPAALVFLYMSAYKPNRDVADDAIRHFINSCKNLLPKQLYPQCVPILLDFCKLLSQYAGIHDQLYSLCRSCLGTMVECTDLGEKNGLVGLGEVLPFVSELVDKLSKDLDTSIESAYFLTMPSMAEVKDFTSFVVSVRLVPEEFADELRQIFFTLLSTLDRFLVKLDLWAKKNVGVVVGSQFLALLKELNRISKLCHGCEEMFWESMKRRKGSLCDLILRGARRGDDHNWISECKEVTTFEARRHLAMMLIPEVKGEDYDNELCPMLIDRADLLKESFDYIMAADLNSLRAGLFVEFSNEVAVGPGVLREWFVLVCQAIFNHKKKSLFVACPHDRRRFFPAAIVSSRYREDFNFVGRVIALALMHNVQVGILFDRVFFQQLAEHTITLEDIRDADPVLYSSCKHILEMDAEVVDQDVLGLTFIDEIKENKMRRVVELCPGGQNMVVNSKNRRQYVDSLVQHRFVKETAPQVEHFARGFGDILNSRKLQKYFFQCLNPEDLDLMLHGSDNDDISVADWKLHTHYNGFKASDEQIVWFWDIVENMTKEQKEDLLFFWTAIKNLPKQGFSGLPSRLCISKSFESADHLPSSDTCFYGLCFPAYPSLSAMRDIFSSSLKNM